MAEKRDEEERIDYESESEDDLWRMRRREKATDDDEDDSEKVRRVEISLMHSAGCGGDESDGLGGVEDESDDGNSKFEIVEEEVAEGSRILKEERSDSELFSKLKDVMDAVDARSVKAENKIEEEPFIEPRIGLFFMHDDPYRGRGHHYRGRQFGGEKLAKFKDEEKWSHDKFEEMTIMEEVNNVLSDNIRRDFGGDDRGHQKNQGIGRGYVNSNKSALPVQLLKPVRGKGQVKYRPRFINPSTNVDKQLGKQPETTLKAREFTRPSKVLYSHPHASVKHASAPPNISPTSFSEHDIIETKGRGKGRRSRGYGRGSLPQSGSLKDQWIPKQVNSVSQMARYPAIREVAGESAVQVPLQINPQKSVIEVGAQQRGAFEMALAAGHNPQAQLGCRISDMTINTASSMEKSIDHIEPSDGTEPVNTFEKKKITETKGRGKGRRSRGYGRGSLPQSGSLKDQWIPKQVNSVSQMARYPAIRELAGESAVQVPLQINPQKSVIEVGAQQRGAFEMALAAGHNPQAQLGCRISDMTINTASSMEKSIDHIEPSDGTEPVNTFEKKKITETKGRGKGRRSRGYGRGSLPQSGSLKYQWIPKQVNSVSEMARYPAIRELAGESAVQVPLQINPQKSVIEVGAQHRGAFEMALAAGHNPQAQLGCRISDMTINTASSTEKSIDHIEPSDGTEPVNTFEKKKITETKGRGKGRRSRGYGRGSLPQSGSLKYQWIPKQVNSVSQMARYPAIRELAGESAVQVPLQINPQKSVIEVGAQHRGGGSGDPAFEMALAAGHNPQAQLGCRISDMTINTTSSTEKSI